MDWVNLIQTFGVAVAVTVYCLWKIDKDDTRAKDEAKERESKLMDTNTKHAEADIKKAEADMKNADALVKVADTIEQTSEINKSLMDKLANEINEVKQDVQKVLGIINKD